MNTLTYLAADPMRDTLFKNIGEAIEYSSLSSIFGFVVVFAVLILIWGVLSLMKVFFYTIPNAKSNPTSAKKEDSGNVKNSVVVNNSAAANIASADSFSGVVAIQDSNASIAAAIIAAISAFRAEHGESVNGFRVVSFKKRK